MTSEERQALIEVLAYLGDEQEHYEACRAAGEEENHIYSRVLTLEGYLNRTRAPGQCLVCEKPIGPGEDESTYCGSVHAGECHEQHLRACAVCDEEATYHGETQG